MRIRTWAEVWAGNAWRCESPNNLGQSPVELPPTAIAEAAKKWQGDVVCQFPVEREEAPGKWVAHRVLGPYAITTTGIDCVIDAILGPVGFNMCRRLGMRRYAQLIWVVAMGLATVLIAYACFAVPGCTQDLDEAQFRLHEQAAEDAQLFVKLGRAYAAGADDMAGKKHDLQGQLIGKVDSAWGIEHTNAQTGKVEATAEEWALYLKQRDAAVAQRYESLASWTDLSRKWGESLDQYLTTTQVIFAKDTDVYEAKKKRRDLRDKALGFVIAAASGGAAGTAAYVAAK